MQRGAEYEVVRQQMMGLVALLLSLAALADRACCIPHRARMRSLSYLRMAESAFIAFIADVTGMQEVPPDEGGSTVEDARRMAARFRALAILMAGSILRLYVGGKSSAADPGVPSGLRHPSRSPKFQRIAGPAPRPFDTS